MPRQNTAVRPKLRELKPLWNIDAGDYVNDIAWSPDGERLVAGAASGFVVCLNAADGGTVSSWTAHQLGTLNSRWSFDGAYLATAGQDGKATIVDGRTFDSKVVLDHGSDWVEHLAWAPKQNILLTAAGKVLRIWNASGALIDSFAEHESTISGVRWNPGRPTSFATTCYGNVRVFNLGVREPKRRLQWKGSLLNVEYAPNGKVIVCGCQDGAVHFWLMPSGDDLEMNGYPTKVRELAWDHKSRFLATGGGQEVVVWDFSGKGPAGSKPAMLSGHESFVSQLAYQPNGTLLASGGYDGRLFMWNPPRQKQPQAYAEVDSEISKLAWNSDGTLLASAEASGSIRLWQSE